MSETVDYLPLHQASIAAAGCYVQEAFNPSQITADSPAIDAMTDLSRVASATIESDATLEEANQSMILRGVRLLLVVDGGGNRIIGVLTSADVLGEKPLFIAQKRQTKRSDLRIVDVMVPVEQMEALGIEEVRKSRVGNVVATLRVDGRAHALVVGHDAQHRQVLVGIFSATQIARQLGVQIHTHEIARTFAEIEAVIAGI
ncbi:MAG: CBS domain-containing protein [Curvibacter sp.]|nr:CBS domain-containing protein [Curvibacter sp.]